MRGMGLGRMRMRRAWSGLDGKVGMRTVGERLGGRLTKSTDLERRMPSTKLAGLIDEGGARRSKGDIGYDGTHDVLNPGHRGEKVAKENGDPQEHIWQQACMLVYSMIWTINVASEPLEFVVLVVVR
jgi:hypothetical protein